MAKMAKDTQTDYTRGGKAISDTAIPLYQTNLTRMDEYLENPQRSINTYLDTYFNPESNATYSDFLRNYTRNMANTTAHNYSATGGGYSTSGQRAYDDQQRFQNDLASRLRQYGIDTASTLANRDFQNMRGANADYNAAYQLGKSYSDIERYNNMVDQNNSFLNQLSGVASGAGKVLSAIPTPWTQAIGAALQVGGSLGGTDVSHLASTLGAGAAQSAIGGVGSGDIYTNISQGLAATANEGGNNWITRLYGAGSNPTSVTNSASQSATSPARFGSGQSNSAIQNSIYNYLEPYTSGRMASNSGFGKRDYFGGLI